MANQKVNIDSEVAGPYTPTQTYERTKHKTLTWHMVELACQMAIIRCYCFLHRYKSHFHSGHIAILLHRFTPKPMMGNHRSSFWCQFVCMASGFSFWHVHRCSVFFTTALLATYLLEKAVIHAQRMVGQMFDHFPGPLPLSSCLIN